MQSLHHLKGAFTGQNRISYCNAFVSDLRVDSRCQRVHLVSELTCVRKGPPLYHCQGRYQITELSGIPTIKAFAQTAVFRHQGGVIHSLRGDGCVSENCMG